jgi:hypothetical protein
VSSSPLCCRSRDVLSPFVTLAGVWGPFLVCCPLSTLANVSLSASLPLRASADRSPSRASVGERV